MAKTDSGKSPFSKVSQIGIIVKDLEKAVDYYQSLGIGPFGPGPSYPITERKLNGKPVPVDSISMRIAIARVETASSLGPVELELIQPTKGPSVHMNSLQAKGEGSNHLGFFVDDLEGEEARMVERGFQRFYSLKFEGGGGASYFNTEKVAGGLYLELIQWPANSPKKPGSTPTGKVAKMPFTTLHHIGLVVSDADRATRFYQSLGVEKFTPNVVVTKDRRLGTGEPIEKPIMKTVQAHCGGVRIEVIQPISGKWSVPWQGFLDKHGEGMAHLAFLTRDVEGDQATAVKAGVRVIYYSRYENGGATTYFETQGTGGLMFELFQRPRDYVPHD